MDRCGEKPDYVRGVLEGLELGGVDTLTGKVRVVDNTKTVRKNDVFEAKCLSEVIILWFIRLLTEDETVGAYIREILAASRTTLPHTASARSISVSLCSGVKIDRGRW